MSEKYDNELSNIDSEQKIICSKKHYLKLSARESILYNLSIPEGMEIL